MPTTISTMVVPSARRNVRSVAAADSAVGAAGFGRRPGRARRVGGRGGGRGIFARLGTVERVEHEPARRRRDHARERDDHAEAERGVRAGGRRAENES